MDHGRRDAEPVGRTPQGEALAVWTLWGAFLVAMGVTYARVPPEDLYEVSARGLAGGLSRVVLQLNFPIALAAIALVLVAAAALPARAWWIGGPAIGLSAVTMWPGLVDDGGDLEARWVNAVPVVGVALALGLTVAAARAAGGRLAAHRPFDAVRWALAGVVTLASVPWIAAEVGLFVPDGVWIAQRPVVGDDGVAAVAVHLGHHHGLDGALLVVTALVLSRVRVERRAIGRALTGYLSLMFAYGLLNLVQDGWHEQIVKRGWSGLRIPSALTPSVSVVWLVILALTAVVWLVLRREPGGGTGQPA